MNELKDSSTCERANDLVSVLYGEASERETRDFELHLKQCSDCRAEFASFARVRESIGEWRDEALTGFVSSPVVAAPVRKSATAALRQFFDLSPLWMKAAVGFGAMVFCVLAVLAVMRLQPHGEAPASVAIANPDAVYTKEDVQRMVQQAKQEALAQQQREVSSKPRVVVESSSFRNANVAKSTRVPRAQRPFSRAEREQLAAELRLVSTSDDLDLFGDRINK